MKILHALLAATLALQATAQVVINEVNFTPQDANDDRWIEIANPGTDPVDLTGWSIYYATQTPRHPGNYWYPLPVGTTIPANGFLRVHWFEPRQTNTATDIWTGQHVLHFLFGYGAEPLLRSGGALALMRTQRNQDMNTASFFADWVSWGDSGYRREDLAIAVQLWTAGEFAVAPLLTESLALDEGLDSEPTPSWAFFVDATPTPNAPNTSGSVVEHYGLGCAVGSVSVPTIDPTSAPVSGNSAFALRVDGTDGTTQAQLVAVILSFLPANGIDLMNPLFTCPVWIELAGSIPESRPASGGGQGYTEFPFPLTNVGPSGSMFIQAIVLRVPGPGVRTEDHHGGSDGLEIRIGS